MGYPEGRVVEETNKNVIQERARCIGIVRAAMDRFQDQPLVCCVLAGLLEDMAVRRLMPEQE